MKKILFALCAVAGITGAVAQDDNPLQFFPNEEGTQMVTKCYDANGNHKGTMTMTVVENYEYVFGQELDLAYVITDATGNIVNQGKVDADYMDGNFRMAMTSNALSPTISQYVSLATEISGDLLDYPNPNSTPYLMESDFEIDGGTFTIRSADDKRPVATVRKYGRQIEGLEEVKTPAGTFDATKISFTIEVQEDNGSTTYRGMEWYSAGSGVVRSEIYDEDKNLLDYTELASIDIPKRR